MGYGLKIWPEDFETVKSKAPEENSAAIRCHFFPAKPCNNVAASLRKTGGANAARGREFAESCGSVCNHLPTASWGRSAVDCVEHSRASQRGNGGLLCAEIPGIFGGIGLATTRPPTCVPSARQNWRGIIDLGVNP